MSDSELNQLRKEISQVDAKVLPLLVQRLELAAQIAQVKSSRQLPTRDESREQQVLQQVKNQPCRPEATPALVSIYQAVMQATRDFEDQEME